MVLVPMAANAELNTFTENFENHSNVGAWTFGNTAYETIEQTGGNPGAFLHNDWLDTIGPRGRTTLGVESIFTGDYHERGVLSVGIDFALFHVDYTAVGRPVTLILYSDADTPDDTTDDCRVYRAGKSSPAPNGKWQSYSFDVPSDSERLPRRWTVWNCGTRSDDEAWELVIEDVDQLAFFWGDPELFYIFQMFDVGLDNPTITWGDEEPEEE
jgi:hypothetical protein